MPFASRKILGKAYHYLLKPLLFQIDPESVHNSATLMGEQLGNYAFPKQLLSKTLVVRDSCLSQSLEDISFENPVGLSAGFDYEGRLTQILPSLGFGFETVGTISNRPYSGNDKPRLGRLPKSQSLMVNKGFKNLGAEETSKQLAQLQFQIPIGISLGRTNDAFLNQKGSILDIVSAFTHFEESNVTNSYYELNISCPNLHGNVSFYSPQNLKELLIEIDKLQIKKPVFVKMPINNSDTEIHHMLKVIASHSPVGVIFGNLQKNRQDPSLNPLEVKRFTVGNFSGRPTYVRSNELISLTYKNYHKRLIVIGTGGIFSADDAYEKIRRGASLVQLITGIIFKGPQVISEINSGLIRLLKRDGFTHISEAIGTKA